MIAAALFPRLVAENHRITSPPDTTYNCIGWAAGDVANWWQAGLYWPFPSHPLDDTVAELRKVFQSLGYTECPSGDLEPGFDRVALYGISERYTHAARQLPDGRWTSKLGTEEDIEHDSPDVVAGGVYGEVALFMKRKQVDPI